MTQTTLVGVTAFNITSPSSAQYNTNLLVISGSGNLYIATHPGVSPTTFDKEIGIAGQATYLPGTDLWLCTDVGATIVIYYSQDGSTVDLGTLNLAPGSQVATNSGNYPHLQGSVTASGAAGQPLFISLPLLNNQIAGPLNGTEQFDITAFSSLIFVIILNNPGITLNKNNFGHLEVIQGSNTQSPSAFDTAEWLVNDTVIGEVVYTLQVPVRDRLLQSAILTLFTNGIATPWNAKLQMYGSSETITAKRYVHQGGLLTPGAPSGTTAVIAGNAIGTTTTFIESYNGPASLKVIKDNTTSVCAARLYYNNSGALTPYLSYVQIAAGAVAGTLSDDVILPMRPVELSLAIGAAAANNYAVLNQ